MGLWKEVSTTEDVGRTVVVERNLGFGAELWLWKEISTTEDVENCGRTVAVERNFHSYITVLWLWKEVSTAEDVGRTVIVERNFHRLILVQSCGCGRKFPQLRTFHILLPWQ